MAAVELLPGTATVRILIFGKGDSIEDSVAFQTIHIQVRSKMWPLQLLLAGYPRIMLERECQGLRLDYVVIHTTRN